VPQKDLEEERGIRARILGAEGGNKIKWRGMAGWFFII